MNNLWAKQALLFGFLFAFSVSAEEVSLPSLTIGTNTYRNVIIKKRNASEAVVSFDGGKKLVKLRDLPEPYRSRWFDVEKYQKAQEKRAADRMRRAREQTAKSTALAKEFMDRFKPLRVIEGKLYDFTFVIQQERTAVWVEKYVVRGIVKQVRDDGLLIEKNGGGFVFLMNGERTIGVSDRSPTQFVALPIGQYQYTDSRGSILTIPKYDAGIFFDPAKHKFDTLILLRDAGDVSLPLKTSVYVR